ncbi:hypothetical protein ACN20G_09050 [Streptomyces sp. BI20]|uniref:hypothetical protein n=1 Tax=Streptomyces sp. BI20 TaxID=3403460 RepID=UPI003C7367F0
MSQQFPPHAPEPNPYGAQPHPQAPYGQENPYGQAPQPQAAGPYGAQPAQPAAAPYGQAPAAPAAGGNPFAQQPPQHPQGPQPAPGVSPWIGDAGANAVPAEPTPAPRPTTPAGFALALVGAVVVGLVFAVLYGWIAGATGYSFSLVAALAGLAAGVVAGKVGGANPVLPILVAIVSAGSVVLGQLATVVFVGMNELNLSLSDMFALDPSVTEIWKESLGLKDFLFIAVGGYLGFSTTRKSAGAN